MYVRRTARAFWTTACAKKFANPNNPYTPVKKNKKPGERYADTHPTSCTNEKPYPRNQFCTRVKNPHSRFAPSVFQKSATDRPRTRTANPITPAVHIHTRRPGTGNGEPRTVHAACCRRTSSPASGNSFDLSYAFFTIHSRRSDSDSCSRIAATSPAISLGWTTRPSICGLKNDPTPPTSVVTIGTRAAIASTIVLPHPSYREDRTNRSAPRHRSSCEDQGSIVTISLSLRS